MRSGLTALLVLVAALSLAAASDPEPGHSRSGHPETDRDASFDATATPLDAALRKRMTGKSWHEGCPVGLGKLRLIELTHWGFDGEVHHGRLIVHRRAARDIVAVMKALFADEYPIRRMVLIDRYGADDHRSMAADNTSAFNCRFINGQPGVWSEHAYGRAIDVNPVENPYVSPGGSVSPPAGEPFADRSKHEPGMIHGGDSTARAFAAQGWEWGGNWSPEKDYQHFSSSGD